jgi:ABC-type iron transport system FetAB ATPase subunit
MPFLMREAVQERLRKRIDDVIHGFRQNVGVIGPSGVGKSSLLREIFQSISRDPKLLPIYIQGETIDRRQLAERWMGAVLSAVLLGRTLNIPNSLAALIREAEPLIPLTVQAVKHIQRLFRQEKNSTAVRELFGLSMVLARETGKKIVLMIDEFQALEKLSVPDPFAILGKQIMPDKEVLYIVTSSARDRAIEIFREKLSLLFGNFEVLELAPLTFPEMESYLATRMPAHRWSPELSRFIFRMTDGEPLYLDLIIQRIESQEVREIPQAVSAAVLLDALCQELFDNRGRIALLFERRLEQCARLTKQGGPYLRALLAMSLGRHKLIPVAAYIEETVAETQKVLKRLVQEGIAVKSGSFYHVQDFLFRFWLREVYLRRHSLFLPEERCLRKALFEELTRVLGACERMSEEDIGLRVESLLKEFRNDTLEIDQKKVQCPQFSEVTLRPLSRAMVSILARGSRGKWLFLVSPEWLGESEAEILLHETKHHRKIQKKVLIVPAGIDQNAKLMAQEAKLQLWDLRHFNTFMDFYDLPKIIISTNAKANDPKKEDGPTVGPVAQGVPALKLN